MSDTLAAMNEGRSAQRIPYAEASRVLLRDSILNGMRDLLLSRDWSSITLSDVAAAAGISRQTIYNEFGSRQGLAQGYAMRLADSLVDAVEKLTRSLPHRPSESAERDRQQMLLEVPAQG